MAATSPARAARRLKIVIATITEKSVPASCASVIAMAAPSAPSGGVKMYIPATVYARMWGPGNGLALFGRAKPGLGLTMDGALDETRVALRTHFHARPGQPDNFDVLTPDAIRGFIDQLLSMMAAIVAMTVLTNCFAILTPLHHD